MDQVKDSNSDSDKAAFNASSTADEVLEGIDLTGMTAVVTGASGGLGLETARAFAARGAHVVLAARDSSKLTLAVAGIRAEHPNANVETLEVDLASLASVRAFAERLLVAHDRVHILVNNAGVMCTPFGHTADGFELQFGTNHLGHFLLTNLIAPALLAAGSARVVNVSSAGHAMGTVDFDDPNFEHRAYDGWASYGQSKTANMLFAVELDRRLRNRGVSAFSVHPGGIQTDLARYMTSDDIGALMARIQASDAAAKADNDGGGTGGGGGFAWKTVPAGAATSCWAATSSDLEGLGGNYCEDCHVAPPASDGRGAGYQDYAVDPDAAVRLWALSERLVGQTFA